MGNPFFNPGNRNQNYQPNSPMGNMQNMFSQFQQFRNNFRGDPRQQVQDLLNSGRMSSLTIFLSSRSSFNQCFISKEATK